MLMQSGTFDTMMVRSRRAIGFWLIAVTLMVGLMVVVGGATRLTESGLSIVKWQPLSGALPPLSAADWEQAFAAYKASPQYLLVNHGMDLAAYKTIFWWEWAHRFLGRVIGLAFALPLVWFWWRRPAAIEPLRQRLLVILALGFLQGLIGWWMVASGLVDRPSVSHYRLTVHLINALLIYAACLWLALDLLTPPPIRVGRQRRSAILLLGLTALQLVLGGLVAGLRAGYAFNTWPMMGEHMMPPGLTDLSPWWRNLVDNPVMVQFLHRTNAYIILLLVLVIFVVSYQSPAQGPDRPAQRRAHLLLAAIVMQILLGILTILNGVPILLGVLHQGGAVILLATAIMFAQHQFSYRLARATPVFPQRSRDERK